MTLARSSPSALRHLLGSRTFVCIMVSLASPAMAQSDGIGLNNEENEKRPDWKIHGRLLASYRYSDWNPGSLKGATYDTTGLNIAAVELDLEHFLTGTSFFPKLPQVRYEWTPSNSELQSKIADAQFASSDSDPSSYFRMLGDVSLFRLGFLEDLLDDSIATMDFEYERFAFASEVTANTSRTFVPFDGAAQTLNAGDSVEGITVFEKWTAELDLIGDLSNDASDHSVDLGVFYLTYEKPYAVTLNGIVVDESIRASKFSAVGLSFYYDGRFKLSGAPTDGDGFYATLGANLDFGIGDIKFANDQSIADFIDETKSVHYYGLGADGALRYVNGPFSFDLNVSWRYHTFEQADNVNGGSFSSFQVGTLDVNTDQVLYLSAELSIVF